jgi:hypothetical protein
MIRFGFCAAASTATTANHTDVSFAANILLASRIGITTVCFGLISVEGWTTPASFPKTRLIQSCQWPMAKALSVAAS